MNNPSLVIIMALLLLALVLALILTLFRLRASVRAGNDGGRAKEELLGRVAETDKRVLELQGLLTQQLAATQQLLQDRLSGQEKALREQTAQQATAFQGQTGLLQKHMQGTQNTLSLVTEKLGMVQQASRQMVEMRKEWGELQRLLKAPKLRGQLGELGLESLLSDILPPTRVTYQYAFNDGKKVDAMIHLERGLLPIDAKFPIEDFQNYVDAPNDQREQKRREFKNNLKKKIDSISKLYVRPGEGTLPLALMYLPAESLYYEAFVAREHGDEDLWTYAFDRSVLPLSPATMVAYLKTVAMGLKAASVEKNAGKVLELLSTLERDLAAFTTSHDVLGGHIAKAHAKFQENRQELGALAAHLGRARTIGGKPEEEGEPPGAD